MIIKGLNQDFYLINNPIWIEVDEINSSTKYLEIAITNITDQSNPVVSKPIRLYNFGSKTRYNLQEVIKGNFPAPNHPTTQGIDGADLGTNYVKFTFSIMEIISQTFGGRTSRPSNRPGVINQATDVSGDVSTFTKTFIRGGTKTMRSNETLQRGEILKVSEKIPRWGGYPIAKYYLGLGDRIRYSSFVGSQDVENRQIVGGCEPLYIRFLNSKGGYSFWLFETFEEITKHRSGDTILGENQSHTGFTLDRNIQAETRVGSSYFDLMEDLFKSAEVHIYQFYGLEWAEVTPQDNTFKRNNYETVQKISITLAVLNTEEPSITW